MNSSGPVEPPTETVHKLRKTYRKVKTGCLTCKQDYNVCFRWEARRVKCDESFPACNRCITSGRVCDGYGIWGGGGLPIRQDFTQLVHSRKTPTAYLARGHGSIQPALRVGSTATPGIRVTPEQQPYLEWFIHGTAVKTPRIFNSPFWDPAIFQAAMREPMILSALLALSSAHKKRTLQPTATLQVSAKPDKPEIFLLKHYGSALRNLQTHLADSGALTRSRLLPAIFTCAIFTLLEYLRNNQTAGILHLRSGFQLVQQLMLEPGESIISTNLVQFHNRLFDQGNTYQHHQPFPAPDLPTPPSSAPVSPSTSPPPTLRFTSPDEADDHIGDLIAAVTHIAEQSRVIPLSEKIARARLHDEHCYLLAAFESWAQARHATVTDLGERLTPELAARYNMLHQRYKMGRQLADGCMGVPSGSDEVIGGTKGGATRALEPLGGLRAGNRDMMSQGRKESHEVVGSTRYSDGLSTS